MVKFYVNRITTKYNGSLEDYEVEHKRIPDIWRDDVIAALAELSKEK